MGPDWPATCAVSGVEVIEVDRPNRQKRRSSGKSDPLDAVEAARAALGGRATGSPKSRDGAVEAIRVLVVAKRSARQARVKALIQMRHLGYSAPEQLRCRLKGLSVPALVAEGASSGRRDLPIRSPPPRRRRCRRWHIGSRPSTASWPSSTSGSRRSSSPLCPICSTSSASVPNRGCPGDGGGRQPRAASLEAAWAHLCGVAPVPDGSGKTSGRVKAHDGGDRQANSALWRIVMVRIAHDPETQLYFERRVKEGKTSTRSSAS